MASPRALPAVSLSRRTESAPATHAALAAWADRYAEAVIRCLEGGRDVGDTSASPAVPTVPTGARSPRTSAGDETPDSVRLEYAVRARRSRRNMATVGRWAGRVPFGYRRQAAHAEGRPSFDLAHGQPCPKGYFVTLVPDPVEAELVRWMFEAYAMSDMTSGDVLRRLRERVKTAGPGGVPLRPDLSWTLASMFNRLRCVTYLGIVRFGRRQYDRHEGTRIRPDSECVIVRDAHPALVSQVLFDRVQQRLTACQGAPRPAANPSPLSGVVRCAQCGSHFRGRAGRPGPPGDPTRYRSYIDGGGEPRADGATPPCLHPIATISGVRLEAAVIDAIADLVQSELAQAAVSAAMHRCFQGSRRRGVRARARVEQHRERLTSAKRRLLAAVEVGALSLADVEARNATIEQERRALELEVSELLSPTAHRRRRYPSRKVAIRLAHDFRGVCGRIAGRELRELLVPWIREAVFDKASRTLTLILSAPWEPASSIVVRRVQFPARAHAAMLRPELRQADQPHPRYPRQGYA